MKRCSKCGTEYPATREYFNERKGSKDGLRGYCRKCHSHYATQWDKAHPEQAKELGRQKANRYRQRNREKVLQRTREWKAKNPDNAHNYRAANRAMFALYTRTRKDRVAGLPNTLTPEQWQLAIDHFGGCCAVCGRSLYGVLHTPAIDHWIPISDPRCPGLTVANAIPLCHGVGGCNNSKGHRDPEEWLVATFGKRRAKVILARILAYFTSLSNYDGHVISSTAAAGLA